MGTDQHDLTNTMLIGGSLTGFAALLGALRSPVTNWRFWVAALAGIACGSVTVLLMRGFAPGVPTVFVGVAGMAATFLATVGTEAFVLKTPLEVVAKTNLRGDAIHAGLVPRTPAGPAA